MYENNLEFEPCTIAFLLENHNSEWLKQKIAHIDYMNDVSKV
ncbi:hypothetical protein MODO_2535 [Myroides odoratimimus]|nr:hypothetical protein MODO_2535 [Myroides odoratimimus]